MIVFGFHCDFSRAASVTLTVSLLFANRFIQFWNESTWSARIAIVGNGYSGLVRIKRNEVNKAHFGT